MLEQLRVYLADIFAPGVEESKNNEIRMIVRKNGSFKVDMESFRKSDEVKRQIDYIRNEERA
ncbi:hypothetical protein HOR41_gp09 [Pseudoalteromonas phage C5a]|uniref:Uncharacterized protein n=1 Tax=Pseudoalteromonas phage C5a TaxID=1916107 RepID=A0A1L5C298_9CAUD|nr:hypothetical protein HOR41_gp09 [Pseudoalteromonas phage C5a]APM00219.1 hypothetical protein [Pseudoalteromonas phage C5a]